MTATEVWQGNWHCPSSARESMTELLSIFSILFLIKKRRVNKMPQVIKRLDSLFKLSLEPPSPEKESMSFQDRENEENSLIHRNVLR